MIQHDMTNQKYNCSSDNLLSFIKLVVYNSEQELSVLMLVGMSSDYAINPEFINQYKCGPSIV